MSDLVEVAAAEIGDIPTELLAYDVRALRPFLFPILGAPPSEGRQEKVHPFQERSALAHNLIDFSNASFDSSSRFPALPRALRPDTCFVRHGFTEPEDHGRDHFILFFEDPYQVSIGSSSCNIQGNTSLWCLCEGARSTGCVPIKALPLCIFPPFSLI